jgi:hypothetical protein
MSRMRRPPLLASLAILLFSFSTAALAAPPNPPAPPATPGPPAAKPKPRVAVKPKPAAPAAPPPDVRLTIEVPTTRGTWTMRVTNAGDVPVRIAADARLLSFDVTPRSARKTAHCVLPADLRPSDELDRALVVPPKRAYTERFEPRLYCFGAAEADALVPGATVVAHLGWTGKRTHAPYEVEPIEDLTPAVSPIGALDAPAIALPDEPTASPPTTAPGAAAVADPVPAHLSIFGPRAIDAGTAIGIDLAVTLRNDGDHHVMVRFRPEQLSFDVIGPAGAERCGIGTPASAPTREAFSTLGSGGSATLSVVLSSYCTGHTLDQAGLLVVRPRLDTRRASGAEIGLRTFDGEVLAAKPTLVRLHNGTKIAELHRPVLAPE